MNKKIIPQLNPPVHSGVRYLDLHRVRRYLAGIAIVAARGAEHLDACETVASAEILRRDAGRGLAALEAGR